MVGVEVGDDQFFNWPVQPVENLRPSLAYMIFREAGIDNDPAFVVAEQPEVDVIELERQRQAQPDDARRALGQLASSRRMGVGIMQGHESLLSDETATYHTVAD